MSSVSQKLQQLTKTIESLETDGTSITEFSSSMDDPTTGGGLTVQFSVEVPVPVATGDEAFTVTEAEVNSDGSVVVSFEGDLSDSELECGTETESEIETSSDLPPHRDPSALRTAYENCDTFFEMREMLGVSVTAEAVRQQMVKHGIHDVADNTSDSSQGTELTDEGPDGSDRDTNGEPVDSDDDVPTEEGDRPEEDGTAKRTEPTDDATNESSAATNESTGSSPESNSIPGSEVIVSDGGFPVELTMEELTEVVQSSQTLYGVTQRLDVDQNEAREILTKLNILDLVTGRLSGKDRVDVTREEINRRIRSSNVVN